MSAISTCALGNHRLSSALSSKWSTSVETLEGIVESIRYRTDDGYAVLQISVKDRPIGVTIVGKLSTLAEGEHISVVGQWVEHPQFGRQFKVKDFRATRPKDNEGLLRYLQSGIVEGVGPSLAKRLVDALGDKLFELAEHDPLLLMQVPGIGKKRAKMIAAALREQESKRDTFVFLQGLGLGKAQSTKVFEAWGEDAEKKISADPYLLVKHVDGFGFARADALAQRLGVREDSPFRLSAALLHLITERKRLGDTCIDRNALVDSCAQFIAADPIDIEDALELLHRERLVVERKNELGDSVVGERSLMLAEERIATRLAQAFSDVKSEQDIGAISISDQDLSEEQIAALKLAGKSALTIITGGPGTGKTTVLKSLVRAFEKKDFEVALAAPTGRAAKRVSEATGRDASTIHRLLGARGGSFRYNKHESLPYDVVIIDEASMLDIWLARALFDALAPHSRMVLVGDVDQLPSVGPGNVLSDMIDSRVIPTARLTQIFRQASQSAIVRNAHRIREGKLPEPSPTGSTAGGEVHLVIAANPEQAQERLLQVCCQRIPQAFGLDAKRDVQVLAPMHRGAVGTIALNQVLQDRLNPKKDMLRRGNESFRVGDKVMQTKNDHERDVYNGDLGEIIAIDNKEGSVEVAINGMNHRYQGEELQALTLAYCISIHKSQGSEYPAVVIPLMTQHYMLLQRNLLYTALTRAKKLVVLIGSNEAISLAVRRRDGISRQTRLKTLLAEQLSIER